MNRSLPFALLLAVGSCAVDGIGKCPGKHVNAQERVPAWKHETPQRMCVGMLKEGAVVGFERTRSINPDDNAEYNALTWYRGNTRSGTILPWDGQSSINASRGSTALRRWYWEEGRLWLAFEASYGPLGGSAPGLWRTKSVAPICGEDLDGATVVATQPDQKIWIEAFTPGIRRLGANNEFEQLSFLEPMM